MPRGVWAGLPVEVEGRYARATPEGSPGHVSVTAKLGPPFEAMSLDPPAEPWLSGRFALAATRLGRWHVRGASGAIAGSGARLDLPATTLRLSPGGEIQGRVGLDLGHAFQLRDDLLGVFGDPAATGKPAGDDLREGKRTVLIAHTLEGADERGRGVIDAGLGRADLDAAGVEAMREVIVGSGAVDAVEAEIARLADAARQALKSTTGLSGEALDVLDSLIDFSTARSS